MRELDRPLFAPRGSRGWRVLVACAISLVGILVLRYLMEESVVQESLFMEDLQVVIGLPAFILLTALSLLGLVDSPLHGTNRSDLLFASFVVNTVLVYAILSAVAALRRRWKAPA